jgi:hypothetical protein
MVTGGSFATGAAADALATGGTDASTAFRIGGAGGVAQAASSAAQAIPMAMGWRGMQFLLQDDSQFPYRVGDPVESGTCRRHASTLRRPAPTGFTEKRLKALAVPLHGSSTTRQARRETEEEKSPLLHPEDAGFGLPHVSAIITLSLKSLS